ncbi:MAG TPA: hypothetical protein VHT75_03170 [Acidimicrobiales bacterium]|jgi:hypothetical protein|nr:hypothetical protein [Acidimicrobiales bacterium]
MASQRRAPTKRPPRPAAKKPPPPPSPEGTDGAERVTKTPTAGAAPATASATKTAAKTTGTNGSTSAKAAPAGGVTKTNTGGGNYRPPTGQARSRRPGPPPKPKKPKFTRKTIGAVVALALIGSLVVFFSIAVNSSSTNPTVSAAASGPESVPVPNGQALASVDTARYPATIDGVSCNTGEQLTYHIHAHLAIFVNGQARQVPYGIGIAPPLQLSNNTGGTAAVGGSCFYWLHTHAADGVIHIESPTNTIYTLGQVFDIWGQPLKAGQVGPALGKLTMYVNGKVYSGDPRAIPLNAHDVIQLDVGTPTPAPIAVSFPNGL